MLYNDLSSYNQSGVTFTGILQINVPGISNPIILNNVSVYFSDTVDYSNATTVGVVSINYVSTGLIVIEATADQAEAISQSTVISLNSLSSTTIQSVGSYSASTAEVFVLSNPSASEVSLEY